MKAEKSRVVKAQVKCDHCGKSFQFTMYPMLNLSEYPKLRSKVMDTSIFVPKCPHCGKMNNVPYTMTCNDPDQNLIVCMTCSEEEYQDTLKLYGSGNLYGQMMNYINSNGAVRLVRTPVELAEKLCIAGTHRNDMLMELMKWHLMKQLKESRLDADGMWFLLNGKKQYLLISEKEKLSQIAFQDSWYQEAARAYSPLIKSLKEKPIVVNQSWADRILQPVKVDEPSSAVGFQ